MPNARSRMARFSLSSLRLRAGRVAVAGLFAGVPAAAVAVLGVSYLAFASMPPVPVPAENPFSEAKRVLGKALFFDEQLSTANVVACATCHSAARGGTDPRQARNPGVDGVFNTPDDMLASPGVIHSNAQNDYVRDSVYGLGPQATARAANSAINAAFAPELFWDGRARSQFVDPQTNTVAIVSGGALESQCVNPPLSSVEMAHEAIDWATLATKLQRVQPLDLAADIPPDVDAVLVTKPGYPELFRQAFGDSQITARRIAFAIATYERTLVSDQTAWDRFQAGQQGALSPGQQAGLQTFQQNCAVCHTVANGLFTSETYRNIGLRPPAEDLGRQVVTGNTADRGKFKVPSLRNVGLQRSFMHNGQFSTLTDVVRFYARAPGAPVQFPDNRDPAVPAINFPPQAEAGLVDFLTNALTDPRVAAQSFPFDRPALFTERPGDQASILGGGLAGTGGVVPRIIVQAPPMIGNLDYRIGIDGALGNASARLGLSRNPPVNGRITPDQFVGNVNAAGTGAGQGLGTLHWPLTPGIVTPGQVLYAQWFVTDAGATGGQALSAVARIPFFCGSSGCPAVCGTADFNNDGDVATDADIEAFFACIAGDCCPTCATADFNGDGDVGTDGDIEAFFRVLAGGHC